MNGGPFAGETGSGASSASRGGQGSDDNPGLPGGCLPHSSSTGIVVGSPVALSTTEP
jgi:hypothetical protein